MARAGLEPRCEHASPCGRADGSPSRHGIRRKTGSHASACGRSLLPVARASHPEKSDTFANACKWNGRACAAKGYVMDAPARRCDLPGCDGVLCGREPYAETVMRRTYASGAVIECFGAEVSRAVAVLPIPLPPSGAPRVLRLGARTFNAK